MMMNFVGEPILSRKISIKSMTRHFAGWKIRNFTLDRANQLLEIITDGSKRTIIPLQSIFVTMGRHHYAVDEYHWFWIKYFDSVESCAKEVIMKFPQVEDLERWEKALKLIILSYQGYLHESVPLMIDIFGELIKEIADCEHIVQEDDGAQAAYFSSDNPGNESDLQPENRLLDSFSIGTETLEASNMASTVYQSRLLSSRLSAKPSPFGKSITIDGSSLRIPRINSETSFTGFKMKDSKRLQVPRLNILIMAVGTRGDIQPFRQFGMRLKEDGHRVRLATHELFRSYILEKGLEFYPLAGDPKLLSEFMVKTGGSILPLSAELLKEIPKFHAMICDIVASSWKACLEPDPLDESRKPFAADTIISNPVTYAHVHCAEALGIPLHLMFPQPWVPTKAFPHPLSRMPYNKSWNAENYVSYEIIDRALWVSFERELNNFRASVGLEQLRLGQHGWNLLNYHRVPFAKMWSSSIVPKPKDWPEHVDIVGSFFDTVATNANYIKPLAMHTTAGNNKLRRQQAKASRLNKSRSFDPKVERAKSEDSLLPVASVQKDTSPELTEFLEKEGVIVYVGFGSMIVPNLEEIVGMFLEAAALTKVRLLFQHGWSKIETAKFEELAKIAQDKADRVNNTLQLIDLEGSMIFPKSTHVDQSTQDEALRALERLEDHAQHISEVNSGQVSPKSQHSTEENTTVSTSSQQQTAAGGNWFSDMLASFGGKSRRSSIEPGMTMEASKGSKQQPNLSPSTSPREKLDDWSEVVAPNGWKADSDAFYMGECAHTWLFQQVSAVVHHGGAGTTSTGLLYGRPTWICPFFGDQFFWGEMVHRGKMGPRPCPVSQLTLQRIVDAFELLRQDGTAHAAQKVGVAMSNENGVENAVQAFYKRLPLEDMLCEVSLMEGKSKLAQVYCQECGLKMTSEIAEELHRDASLHMQDHHLLPCSYCDWSVPKPVTAAEGVIQGVGGYVHELIEGVADAVYDPLRGGYANGLQGAATGLVKGLHNLVDRQIQGGAVLYEKIRDGVTTNTSTPTQASNTVGSQEEDSGRDGAESARNAEMMLLYSKKPRKAIDHHSSEKNQAIRNLRINIMQQIQRINESQTPSMQLPEPLSQQDFFLGSHSDSAASFVVQAQSPGDMNGFPSVFSGLSLRDMSSGDRLNRFKGSEPILELSRETDTPNPNLRTINNVTNDTVESQSMSPLSPLPLPPSITEVPSILLNSVDGALLAGIVRPVDPFEQDGSNKAPQASLTLPTIDHQPVHPTPQELKTSIESNDVQVDTFMVHDGEAPFLINTPKMIKLHTSGSGTAFDVGASESSPSRPATATAASDGPSSPNLLYFDNDTIIAQPELAVSRMVLQVEPSLLDGSQVLSLPYVNRGELGPSHNLLGSNDLASSSVVTSQILGSHSDDARESQTAEQVTGAMSMMGSRVVLEVPLRDGTEQEQQQRDSFMSTKAAFQLAREAWSIFERLGGKETRQLHDRRFANLMSYAITRFDAVHGQDVINTSSSPHLFVPYRPLERELLRRPEHRVALIKHFLKAMTREHDHFDFVDFLLLFQEIVEGQK